MAITIKTLRDATWRQIFEYSGATLHFNTFACDDLPGLTITHSRSASLGRGIARAKVKTSYAVGGIKTDSPIQAVRLYNESLKAQDPGGRCAPGLPQSLKVTRGETGL